MKKFTIKATYEYEADEIWAEDEEQAYKFFIEDLNLYYSGMDDYTIEELDSDEDEEDEEDKEDEDE